MLRPGKVTSMMRNSTTAAQLATALEPYFTHRYYYMFDYFNFTFRGQPGVAGYRDCMLGPGGAITSGFQDSLGPIELSMG